MIKITNRKIKKILLRALNDELPCIEDLNVLFKAEGRDIFEIARIADIIRDYQVGNEITYVINRNINFTNVCINNCLFCAYSVNEGSKNAYLDLTYESLKKKIEETKPYSITEVCLQGGIHPKLDFTDYCDLLENIHRIDPYLHIHAFSPQEIKHAANTSQIDIEDILKEFRRKGLGSVPGTAAEILDDSIRKIVCPSKVSTTEWIHIIETAHSLGIPSTATILLGHIENTKDWITHLAIIRDIQEKTEGFTEFIPLPFIESETPLSKSSSYSSRRLNYLDYLLFYSVARLFLGDEIPHLQTSWVKLGLSFSQLLLTAGCNDFGGTLFEENITRCAGGTFGQSTTPEEFQRRIVQLNRPFKQRDTLYQILS